MGRIKDWSQAITEVGLEITEIYPFLGFIYPLFPSLKTNETLCIGHMTGFPRIIALIRQNANISYWKGMGFLVFPSFPGK